MVDGAEIMSKITTTYPTDEDIRPMLPEQFEEAAAKTKIQNADLIRSARLVMVENVSVAEAAKKHGVEDKYLYRAITSIQKMWDKICERKGWLTNTASLPPEVWKVLEAVQLNYARQLKEQRVSKATRKKKSKEIKK
jgi:predicted DNA-binding protein (UPF0251 family)